MEWSGGRGEQAAPIVQGVLWGCAIELVVVVVLFLVVIHPWWPS